MNRAKLQVAVRGVLAVGLLVLAAGIAQACPNCKEALSANGGGGDLVRGYFYSILFMMGMPFTILGAFSFSMYRAVKKAQAAPSIPTATAADEATVGPTADTPPSGSAS